MNTRSILFWSVASCGAALTICTAISCDKPQAAAATQPATQPVSVNLAPVSREPIPDTIDFIGTLYGDEEVLIASKVTGRIAEIFADLGDRVDSGEPIARVDPTDYELIVQQREFALRQSLATLGLDALPPSDFDLATIATVRRAAVQAANAKARLDRAKQLFEQEPPLISPQEYADTETQYEVANQDYDVALLEVKSGLALAQTRAGELAVAKQQLADTVIRAPGPTTQPLQEHWAIAERRTNVGEYMQAGTIVYRVIADQPIKLRTSIPERFLSRVTREQHVDLRVDASPDVFAGVISRVSPAVDAASRTFSIEVTFPNEDHRLRPGTFGRGVITSGTRHNVTTVPADALYSFAGLNKVFTVQDGRAVANIVTVVIQNDKHVVVEGNLGGATEVIVGGLGRLANGTPVTLKPATP